MPHYVFTAVTHDEFTAVGVAVDTDEAVAARIAENLTRDRGITVYATEVQAYTPRPITEGEIVSGATAMTLPRGSAIVRELNAVGHAVRASGALVRHRDGWISGFGGDGGGEVSGIDLTSRYRVLFVGRPFEQDAKR